MNTDDYGTYDRFIAFRAAVMRAIALAWKDDQFRKELIADPKKAMLQDLNYEFPFKNDLAVIPDSAQWDQAKVIDWHVLHRETLHLVLPPAPTVPAQQVEALAAFNAAHLTFLTE